ncbi:MAG: outer membrane beta-barrel protein [Bacteroidetes bacterium]|nr:outer membrane beta-barrel protein [Bacteroidota bacterium]MDA1269461.1 outer membrane beta-barrel protein [Bacteroidota bacterium]
MNHSGRIKKLVVLFLVLLPGIAWAQLSLGIRGGLATSSYSYQATAGTRVKKVEGIAAPTFALVLEYFDSKNAGVELNIQQLTLGFNQINDAGKVNQTEFTYLKFPILASIFAGRSGRFQIKFGPHLGILSKAEDLTREFSGASPKELPTFGKPSDAPKKRMYGLTGGAGISKLFGKSTLSAEARFAYDFTNPESQDRIFDMSSTNLEFTLAYLFRIKERKQKSP